MAPLADDVQHAFLGERHQFGERRVETGGREAVTAEAGIDLHMHARRLAKPACGRGDTVDAGERATEMSMSLSISSSNGTSAPL
mgnify:CR=1 FL=1